MNMSSCSIHIGMYYATERRVWLLQAFAVHASVPHRVCGPVAGDQQALSHLPRGHRDASKQGLAVYLTVTGVPRLQPQGLRNSSYVCLPAVFLQFGLRVCNCVSCVIHLQ